MSGNIRSGITRKNSDDNSNMKDPVAYQDTGKPILDSNSYKSSYSSTDDVSHHHHKPVEAVPPVVGSRGPTYSYEEIGNGLTCPTCNGTGKIPRGQEDDLVALIPYRDKRLKPRRTWMYVCLSIFLCGILAGVLCVFLIPRSIEVVQDDVTTRYVDLNVTENRCFLSLLSSYNITNNNFVSVTTNDIQITVTVMFSKLIVLTQKFVHDKQIGIRQTETISEPLNMTLTNKYFPIVYCEPTITRDSYVYMIFQSTFNFTLMTQTDQQVVTEYYRVNCSPQSVHNQGSSLSMQSVGYFDVPDAYTNEHSL